MTLNAKIQKRFRKITAVISLVVMIVPLFPPATFAQEVTPSLDPTPDPIAQPSDAPAPAPSGLDFNINPGGSNPGIVPNNPSPSNSVPDNSSLVPDSAPTPASSPELSPNTSPEASTPPPQTESIDPTTPPQNEIFDSQTPQHAEINSNNGAFTHRYPIAIPPGRNNVQPKVELAYTSNDTDINSIFGKGWSLSIPYIQRENKYGVDQLYSTTSSPFFFSSIDGELATTTVTSTYAARVDNGSFNSYITTSNQWLVSDKNGTQYKYGYSAASRQDDSTTSAHVFKWMLEEVRDTNDNYISYTYYKDNGEIYLSSITYTGNGATPGVFEIDFQRESRTDTATSSQTGFAVKTNSRINEIDAKVNGTLVHKYALAYTPGASTSLLSSITETGYDESSNPTTLPATMFTYKSNTPGWAGDATWLSPVQLINGSVDQGYQIVDVNGDGLPDIMRSTYTTICCGNPPIFTHDSYINNGHGWSIDHSWDLPVNWMSEGYSNGYQFIDVNGDHLPDIVYSNSNGGYETWINNAHGWTLDSSWNLPVALDTAWPPTDNGYRFTDVNGDGLPDIVRGDSTRGYESYINNGHGWGSDDSSWHVPVALTTNGTTDNGYKIVDVNGDTLPDIVFSQGASTYTSYLNNGHGWTLDSNWNLPVLLRDNSAHDNAYQIVDINGDHLPDIVRGDSTLGYESYINNGHGWGSDDSSWHLPTYLSSNTVARGFKFADVNGDGLMDQLYRQDPDNLAQMGNGQIVDQLTEISHPAGGKTDIQYKHVAGYLDGSNNLTNTTVPFFLNTVYKLSTSDGTTT